MMRLTFLIPVLWLVSFLLSLYFVPSLSTMSMGLSIIALFIWAFYVFMRKSKEWQVPSSYIFYGLMAFWGLAFISVVLSDIFYVSFMAFCFFSVLPLSVIAFAQVKNVNFYKTISKEILFILSLLGLWAVVQVIFFKENFGLRAVNPLSNPNSLAALLNFGVVGAFGWLLYTQRHWYKALAVVGFVLCFAGVLFTGGRGALFAVVPILILFGGVCWRETVQKAVYLVPAVAVLVGVFFYYQSNFVSYAMIERVASIPQDGMNSFLSNRGALWAATWEMIKAHGVLGTGIGTYFLYFPEFRLPTDTRGAYYAHNDPMQFWVEMGVAAPLSFYAIAIGMMVKTFNAFRFVKERADKFSLLIPFFALAVMIIHTHVTFNFSNLSILLVSGFCFGAWFRAIHKIQPYKQIVFKAEAQYKVKAALLGFILFLMAGVMSAFIISEAHTNKAKAALFAGEFPIYAHHVLQAKTLSFDLNHRANLLAATMPITMLEKQQYKNVGTQREIYDQTISYLDQAIHANPRSASPHYYKGYIQKLVPAEFIASDMSSPEEYFLRALLLDPLHLGARMGLASLYAKLGETQKELEVLEAGVQYVYNTENALLFYFRLRALYQAAGNKEQDEALRAKMQHLQERLDKARAKAPE